MNKIIVYALSSLLFTSAYPACANLAEDIIASYEGIRSVSCEIRKRTEAPDNTVRMLSRIFYQRPDRLHVENIVSSIATDNRRIISDGETLYYHVEGEASGYATPLEELDKNMQIELRRIPGTPMDHLLRIGDADEVDLEGTDEYPTRKGYDLENLFVVLSLDAQRRPVRIEFYRTKAMKHKAAQYDYSSFQEVLADTWIPCLHKAVIRESGLEIEETVRVNNLAVNEAIAPSLFAPGSFFEGVRFE